MRTDFTHKDHHNKSVLALGMNTGKSVSITNYVIAAVIGIVFIGREFTFRFASGQQYRNSSASGDVAQHVIAQRYYIHDHWHWPPLTTKLIMPPVGANIGLMDGIPLEAMPLKLISSMLPDSFEGLSGWIVLCYVLQPLAAVFALSSAGEGRLLPNFTVALSAISMPVLLYTAGEAALKAQFLILMALGAYFQDTKQCSDIGKYLFYVLPTVSFFVHPYIFALTVAVMASAPATKLVRGDVSWRRSLSQLTVGTLATILLSYLFGYFGTSSPGGFGYYSMNMLAPIVPYCSLLFGKGEIPNATGGQEFCYLGAGLMALVIAALGIVNRRLWRTVKLDFGLAALTVLLTLFSLSTQVYVGHYHLIDLGYPGLFQQFRSSGRFFWAVEYIALVCSILLVAGNLRSRLAYPVLLTCAVLQFVDAQPLRAGLRAFASGSEAWTVDASTLRPLLASHRNLVLWPTMDCGADHLSNEFLHTLMLASEIRMPVNTMYMSRSAASSCPSFSTITKPLPGGELLIILPSAGPGTILSIPDWQKVCRKIGTLQVCSRDLQGRQDLQPISVSFLPVGEPLHVGPGEAGATALGPGWSKLDPWGTWTDGSSADLTFRTREPVGGALLLGLTLTAFPPLGSTTQHLDVTSNGSELSSFDVSSGAPRQYDVVLPSVVGQTEYNVEIHVSNPTKPSSRYPGTMDNRKVGVAVSSIYLSSASKSYR